MEGVRRRVGWLLFLFLAGTMTKYVSHYFKGVQLRLPDLIDFIPLMIGTGGNAGSQTVGTIIRGIALGEIQGSQAFKVIYREWLTGLLLGTLLGGLGFFYTWALHGNPAFAAVIGLAILFICMWANSVGAVIPLLAKRFGIDPAVVSAPLDQHRGRRHRPGDLLLRRHRALDQAGRSRDEMIPGWSDFSLTIAISCKRLARQPPYLELGHPRVPPLFSLSVGARTDLCLL